MPARRDVGRDEHPHRSRLEILQRAQPLILRTVRMDRAGFDPAALEPARDAIGAVLGASKNENGIELRIAQQVEKKSRLQMGTHVVNELGDRVRRVRAPADLNNLGRALELVRQFFDLARERRGEHERLPLLRQRFHDLPDRRKKTHVEHAIGFIEHEKFEPGEIGRALPHQID